MTETTAAAAPYFADPEYPQRRAAWDANGLSAETLDMVARFTRRRLRVAEIDTTADEADEIIGDAVLRTVDQVSRYGLGHDHPARRLRCYAAQAARRAIGTWVETQQQERPGLLGDADEDQPAREPVTEEQSAAEVDALLALVRSLPERLRMTALAVALSRDGVCDAARTLDTSHTSVRRRLVAMRRALGDPDGTHSATLGRWICEALAYLLDEARTERNRELAALPGRYSR